MATQGSLEWLNSILTQPGFDPYSAEGSAVLSGIQRNDPAFKEIMRLQAMQTNLTPGQAYGWQQFAGQTPDAATAAIADQRFGDLNRQSQAFEDSEKANNGDISMLKRAIATAAAMYGVGNFGFGTGGGLDISGGLDMPASVDTSWGVNPRVAGMTPEEANILNSGAIAEGNYVPTAAEINAAFPTAAVAKTGAQTALQRLMSGTATASDYADLGLKALPGVLGAFGASQQSGKLGSLATQFQEAGAPSRARYEASFAPGFTMASDPGFTDALNSASKSNLYALSTGGNPAGSPNAQQQNMADLYAKFSYPALQNYRNQNASTSGISAFNAAAPSAATGAVGSNAGVYNGIGSAIGSVVNPPQTLADILKQYQESNGGSSIFKVAA